LAGRDVGVEWAKLTGVDAHVPRHKRSLAASRTLEPGPRREKPQLSRPREKMVISLVGLNLLLLFVAPIAGMTFFDIAVAIWHRL
jgi:hypothetical protein